MLYSPVFLVQMLSWIETTSCMNFSKTSCICHRYDYYYIYIYGILTEDELFLRLCRWLSWLFSSQLLLVDVLLRLVAVFVRLCRRSACNRRTGVFRLVAVDVRGLNPAVKKLLDVELRRTESWFVVSGLDCYNVNKTAETITICTFDGEVPKTFTQYVQRWTHSHSHRCSQVCFEWSTVSNILLLLFKLILKRPVSYSIDIH
jgi:hypothetical protein